MRQPEHSDAARVAAANILLDRGWGKPPQAHTGADGEGAVRVTIRHILDGRDAPVRAPRVISEQPALVQIDAAENDDEQ
jgi:hypothetical protein